MKLVNKETSRSWRETFDDSVQVDLVAIPNGETYKTKNDEGREVTKMTTENRICLGFQTASGRGKGMQWIPTDHIDPVLERLKFYADNGVDQIVLNDEWLEPAACIDDTICKTPRKTEKGETIPGKYDIAFRVRLGKGSKASRIPEEDFGDFVALLSEVRGSVPDAITAVKEKIAKDAAAGKKSEVKVADTVADPDAE